MNDVNRNDFSKLTREELEEGIVESHAAIARAKESMKAAGKPHATLGVRAMAASAPKFIDMLEKEIDEMISALKLLKQ